MKRILILFILAFGLMSFSMTDKLDYPTPPKTKERLFYIQRNHNSNTIVYDANFDAEGKLIENKPIGIYWIRYEEDGRKMELRNIEKWYAYGVRCTRPKSDENFYQVKLVANKKRNFKLFQTKRFEANIHTLIGTKMSYLEHMYIEADNSGVWPKVKFIELFGVDIATGEKTYEKIITK